MAPKERPLACHCSTCSFDVAKKQKCMPGISPYFLATGMDSVAVEAGTSDEGPKSSGPEESHTAKRR